jgi:hypothetical protein
VPGRVELARRVSKLEKDWLQMADVLGRRIWTAEATKVINQLLKEIGMGFYEGK